MKELDIQCDFLQNGHCLAVKENEEGRVTREISCKNNVKDFCCYLCDSRKSCDVSCDYLRETKRFTNYKENVDKEIAKCASAIERLSVLFAEGKISEKSYLTSVAALEKKMKRLKEAKEKPEGSLDMFDTPETSITDRPTFLWLLVPLFFGILGGLVAYVGTRDRDRDMALSLLTLGIITSIVSVFLVMSMISSILRGY